MATFQRPRVPQFENWEGEENVPYTAVFDNARKGRGGRMINPNDPQENPDMFPNIASASPPPPSPSKTKPQADELNGGGGGEVRQQKDGNRQNFQQFQRQRVPQFGNWEGEENVPYTAVFDNARKGRGGRMINSNNPQENPDVFPNIASASPPPPSPLKTKPQADEPNGRGGAEVRQQKDGTRQNFQQSQRQRVPQFGNWEGEENVPYTAVFDNARKGRGGRMINSNDPQENPDMFPNIASASPPPPSPSKTKPQADEPKGRGGGEVRQQNNRRASREEGGRGDHNTGPWTAGGSPLQQRSARGSGSYSSRPARQSGGSEHSIDRSHIHSNQAKLSGRGGASPALDGKNSYESSHGGPGKSRTKTSTRGDETLDRGANVPRFGGWNEKNPESAENYTLIFNTVGNERHNNVNVPSAAAGNNSQSSPYHIRQQQNADNKAKGCCFPWLGK